MNSCLRIILLSALLLALRTSLAVAQTDVDDYYQQWVDYKDGAVSLAFDQTPIPFAISALHAKTGIQIIIPPASEARLVNLRVDHQPLEPAVRSLITTIGYRNFALVYDAAGRPNRAIVVNTKPLPPTPASTGKNEATIEPLSKEELDNLQKDLERWNDLKQEDRGRIEDRLKTLPQSNEREELVRLYGRQVLGIAKPTNTDAPPSR
jgi:hypothetical protein